MLTPALTKSHVTSEGVTSLYWVLLISLGHPRAVSSVVSLRLPGLSGHKQTDSRQRKGREEEAGGGALNPHDLLSLPPPSPHDPSLPLLPGRAHRRHPRPRHVYVQEGEGVRQANKESTLTRRMRKASHDRSAKEARLRLALGKVVG